MKYTVLNTALDKQKTDCIIVGIYESGKLTPSAALIDQQLGGAIKSHARSGEISGKPGTTLTLFSNGSYNWKKALVVGLGKQGETKEKDFRKAIQTTVNSLKTTQRKDTVFCLVDAEVANRDTDWKIKYLVESSEDVLYQFNEYKSAKADPIKLKTVKILISKDDNLRSAKRSAIIGESIAAGVSIAKTLGNLPGNVCTPTYLAHQATQLARSQGKLKTTVINEAQMKKLGMGALLSVSAGSAEPAKLIIMEYSGGRANAKPHVLVGKGITFDTGGISLKPGGAMDEMKYDMCGAASVMGAMNAITAMDLKANVIGVITSAENMPDGLATKPGDIVTTMSGQTVEILNTDAEGRLVLCDALTYVEKFKPASVIDIATLTGACIIALGGQASGLMSNDDSMADKVLSSSTVCQDRAWRLPIWEEYQSQLDSNFADMQNIGGREAGSITAACFLARFTKSYPWCHLDIAGTAWLSGKNKGATGRPVPLLVQYLMDQA